MLFVRPDYCVHLFTSASLSGKIARQQQNMCFKLTVRVMGCVLASKTDDIAKSVKIVFILRWMVQG